jgi:acetolactate decarboxylase
MSESAQTHSLASPGRFRQWAGTMLAHRHGHGVHHDPERAHALYQTSTISALIDGIYEGTVTTAELLEHGNFGLGTFNQLDGEMVVNEGVCFHLFSDGEARVAQPDDLTPFAAVTWFAADETIDVEAPTSRGDLLAEIDRHLTSENLFYAIRVKGSFSTVTTRTATRQEAPYPPLTEATESETQQTLTALRGVVVGFRTPDYEQGVSVAGYHLHFLNEDHTAGGHILDFVLDEGAIEISTISEIHLSLPTSGQFLGADLHHADVDTAIRKSES